jgi:bifunctional DNA-binding transcriptional regulator/antitoxin component of YhaV-PrlF toxin-antitoxin module
VVIPAEFRNALGVKVGDDVVIELAGDELRLRSRQSAIKRVQAMVRKYIPDDGRSLADELIAERREEAAREERE